MNTFLVFFCFFANTLHTLERECDLVCVCVSYCLPSSKQYSMIALDKAFYSCYLEKEKCVEDHELLMSSGVELLFNDSRAGTALYVSPVSFLITFDE